MRHCSINHNPQKAVPCRRAVFIEYKKDGEIVYLY